MNTKVGLRHEPSRKLPWLVKWWSAPEPDSGKQVRRTRAFRYKRDAAAFQAEKQAELDGADRRGAPADVTLGQLCGEFYKSRTVGLSHDSHACYRDITDQLRGHFGASKLLREIERRHAEAFIAAQKRRDGRGGSLSSTTIAQRVTYARAVFAAAVDWGYIARNPFTAPRRGASPLRTKRRSRPWQHIEPEEFVRFLAVVPDARRRAAYWLMYGCGLRPGEVYNLTADKIDLPGRVVHVENREATADVPPFSIKADERSEESKERTVPIPEAAVSDLTAAVSGSFKSGGFVVLAPERFAHVQKEWRKCQAGKPWGGRAEHRPWLNRDMINNVLRNTKRYLRVAGITLTAPFKLHTFRKSFAQNHADHGTPPKTLAKLLGHSDIQITMQFYSQVTDANVREAARTVDRLFAASLPASEAN
jgi:integrase